MIKQDNVEKDYKKEQINKLIQFIKTDWFKILNKSKFIYDLNFDDIIDKTEKEIQQYLPNDWKLEVIFYDGVFYLCIIVDNIDDEYFELPPPPSESLETEISFFNDQNVVEVLEYLSQRLEELTN